MRGRASLALILLALGATQPGCFGDLPAPAVEEPFPVLDAAPLQDGDALIDAAPDDGPPPGTDGRAPDADALTDADGEPPATDALPPDGAEPMPDAETPFDAEVTPDGDTCSPSPEVCNDRDDDCDGRADEDALDCGAYVERHCQMTLGWSEPGRAPGGRSISWGPCPEAPSGVFAGQHCASTRRDGLFRLLSVAGALNFDQQNQIAVGFQCDDADNRDLARWTETHCAIYLGNDRSGDVTGPPIPAWGPCPQAISGARGNQTCTSSGRDRQFTPVPLQAQLGQASGLAVAFLCSDATAPQRARQVASQVEVFLTWAASSEDVRIADGVGQWGPCPQAPGLADRTLRCVGSGGDSLFHPLYFVGNVRQANDDVDVLGFALRAQLP